MIDYWLMIFFNLFFTSAPPIMFGIMDNDLSAEMLLGVPELYRTGQRAGVSGNLVFSVKVREFKEKSVKPIAVILCSNTTFYHSGFLYSMASIRAWCVSLFHTW